MNQPTDNPTNLEEMLQEEDDIQEEDVATGDEPEEDEPEDQEEDADIPEKFRGKTVKDVVQSYTELERSMHFKVQEEALRIAQQLMQGKPVDPNAAKEEEDEDDLGLSDEQISKLTPKEFIKLVNKNAIERAQRMVSKTITQQNTMLDSVRREIRDVTKEYPEIKTNKNFRNIIIDMVDAASARGQKLSLKDATKRAADALGIKPGEAAPAAEDKPAAPVKKKLRTAMERPRGTDGEQNKTDDQIVKEGILNAGKKSTALGGLGV